MELGLVVLLTSHNPLSGLSVRGVGSLQESAKACTTLSSDESFASVCCIFIPTLSLFLRETFRGAQILPDQSLRMFAF